MLCLDHVTKKKWLGLQLVVEGSINSVVTAGDECSEEQAYQSSHKDSHFYHDIHTSLSQGCC